MSVICDALELLGIDKSRKRLVGIQKGDFGALLINLNDADMARQKNGSSRVCADDFVSQCRLTNTQMSQTTRIFANLFFESLLEIKFRNDTKLILLQRVLDARNDRILRGDKCWVRIMLLQSIDNAIPQINNTDAKLDV